MKEGVSMKKRVTSLFLALLMAVTLLPVQVLAEEPAAPDTAAEVHQAAEVQEPVETETETDAPVPQESAQDAAPLSTGAVYTGTLGENVSWSLDTGTGALTVTGSGPMEDYNYTNAQSTSPLWNYRSYIKTVTIADTVTTVGDYVFYNCTNLTTVDLGSGVTKIGQNSFQGCGALTEIVLPDSVATIGDYAFYECKALTEIVLPDSVTTIGYHAFAYCGLTEISIPNTVTTIGSSAFQACSNLISVTIGSGVASIGYYAFYSCDKLSKVVISDPDAWLKISFDREYANPLTYAHSLYVGDELLTDLVIPGTVTDISQYAFDGCTSIASVYIPQSVTSIGQYAFNGMNSLKTVRYAGSQADWLKINISSYNDSLTSLTPEFDQSLADYCRITTAATEHGTVAVDNAMAKVGDTVTITAIPAAGYAVESYLVDGVAIPDGGNTFTATGDHVVSATFVKVYDVADSGKACGSCGANIKWALDTAGTLHVYGTGAMQDYNNYGDSPFYSYRDDIKVVRFSGSVTTIGKYAFSCCKGLTEIVIPDNITSIGDSAFRDCSNLTEIVIPTSVTSIGVSAFRDCNSLTEIVIPASITSIGDYAFESCSKLTSAEFLGNIPALFGENAFFNWGTCPFTIFYHSGTTGWTSPTWNGYNTVCRDKITTDFSTLDDSNRNGQGIYFRLNATAKTATVGKNTSDDNNAGYDGGQNGSIVIPDTVTKNGETYNVIGVNQYAFANCAWVNTVSIGRYVSAIEPSAFRGCKNLTAITVDANNLQFADQDGVLFDKCGLYLYAYPAGRAAATYDIPDTCDTVGTQSFYGAVNLTSLTVPTSVKNIGAKAFAQCNSLEEITLPFLGGNAEDNNTFKYVFGSDNWSSYGGVPQSLKTVTVLTDALVGSAFYHCTYIENIYLPNCKKLTEIPYECFSFCTSLHTLSFGNAPSQDGMVVIPDSVAVIGLDAFRSCTSIRGITLGRSTTTLEEGAFRDCTSLAQFAVAKGNTAFMADQWGVLYSRDQTMLHYYPAGRAWPYYNVSDSTTTIGSYAFSSCQNLVNLFVPKTVTSFKTTYYSASCISNCPSITICCYKGSAAASYAISNSLTAWYMDNYKMQGINVGKLPEYVVVNSQGQLLTTPYVTATYGDKELQLDDYDVQVTGGSGQHTLTFTSGGVSTQVKANVIRQGNINGNATAQGDIDVNDVQCLYTYLVAGENTGKIKDASAFDLVSDLNNDGSVDIYDLQLLYETICGNS